MNYNKFSDSKLIMKFAVPQMIGLVFNSVYFIIDGMFIGWRLGPNALAAAGLAIPIVELMIALSMMISVGAGVIISNAFGKGESEEANRIFNSSNLFTLFLSLSIVILSNLFMSDLANFLGASPTLMNDTTIYLRYFLTASPFLVFSFTLSTYVRNDGNPKLAMWSLILGSVANIFLDWLFMYPLNMGMAGAALATALGPIFSVALLLIHFVRKQGNLSFKYELIKLADIKAILKNGLPAFITNFSIGLVTFLYNDAIIKNGLGDLALSAYVIIGYISLIAITSFLGSSQGIQPAISYFDGENNVERIKGLSKSILIFNVVLSLCMTILLMSKGTLFISMFVNDTETIVYTQAISEIYFINLPFAAVNIVIATLFQALNEQKTSTFLSILRSTVPLYFLLLVLPLIFQASSIWWAIIGAEAFTTILSIALLMRYMLKLNYKIF